MAWPDRVPASCHRNVGAVVLQGDRRDGALVAANKMLRVRLQVLAHHMAAAAVKKLPGRRVPHNIVAAECIEAQLKSCHAITVDCSSSERTVLCSAIPARFGGAMKSCWSARLPRNAGRTDSRATVSDSGGCRMRRTVVCCHAGRRHGGMRLADRC